MADTKVIHLRRVTIIYNDAEGSHKRKYQNVNLSTFWIDTLYVWKSGARTGDSYGHRWQRIITDIRCVKL